MRSLANMGLTKPEKLTTESVPIFSAHRDDVYKWLKKFFLPVTMANGGAELEQWVHERNRLQWGLQPPTDVINQAAHRFSYREADTATLEEMARRGELARLGISTTGRQQPPHEATQFIGAGHAVEVLSANTEGEEESYFQAPPTWTDDGFTVVEVIDTEEGIEYAVYSKNAREVRLYRREQVRPKGTSARALETPPRQPGFAFSDRSTERPIGPIVDGLLASGVYDKNAHEPWMCVLIYARLSAPAQKLDKTLLPIFLTKIGDETLRETCAVAAGGRFSNALVQLVGAVGTSPGLQLVKELNETYLSYKDIGTLALALDRRRDVLTQATTEQRLVWEVLRALDHGQRVERNADTARGLRDLRERALARFTAAPHNGAEIFQEITVAAREQVAVRATQTALRGDKDKEQSKGDAFNTEGADETDGQQAMREICYKEAFDGKCDDAECKRKHGKQAIDAAKEKAGADRWERSKKWWKNRQANRRRTPSSSQGSANNTEAAASGSTSAATSAPVPGTSRYVLDDVRKAGSRGKVNLTASSQDISGIALRICARAARMCEASGRALARALERAEASIGARGRARRPEAGEASVTPTGPREERVHVMVGTDDLSVPADGVVLRPPSEAEAVRAITDVMRRINSARVCNKCGMHYTGCIARGRCGRDPGDADLEGTAAGGETATDRATLSGFNNEQGHIPGASPLTCHCGLLADIWQVERRTLNHGRWFMRCPKDYRSGQQCAFFEWVNELPATATAADSGRAMMHVTLDSDEQGRVLLDRATSEVEDDRIYFETSEGGDIVFKQGEAQNVLGRVIVSDNISAEVTVGGADVDATRMAIAAGVRGADEERVTQLAKRLTGVKKRAPQSHRWKHTVATTHKDLARVMIATRNAIVHALCALTPDEPPTRWKFLLDSCSDTHLLSHSWVKARGFEERIDKNVVRNMGTAKKGNNFRTLGMIRGLELEVQDDRGQWHVIVLNFHVADIGDKCIVNTTALKHAGWKFMQSLNKDGSEGSCMVAPDGRVFPTHEDDHGMPILPTRDAPMVAKSKPSGLRALAEWLAEQAGAHRRVTYTSNSEGAHAGTDYLVPTSEDDGAYDDIDNEESSDGDTPTPGDHDALWSDEGDAACMAVIGGDLKEGAKARARVRPVVHTPESWHNLIHAGRLLSEASAKASDARFDINGKVKNGSDLTPADLAALDGARLACKVCKQTKLDAPSARRKKVMFTPTSSTHWWWTETTADAREDGERCD